MTFENNQQAFDAVAVHLRTQGRKSLLTQEEKDSLGDMGAYVTCAYRAKDGTRCGIGGIIPDDQYKVEFEGIGAFALRNKVPAFANLDPYFLASLQNRSHDGLFSDSGPNFLVELEAGLLSVAQEYGLVYTRG